MATFRYEAFLYCVVSSSTGSFVFVVYNTTAKSMQLVLHRTWRYYEAQLRTRNSCISRVFAQKHSWRKNFTDPEKVNLLPIITLLCLRVFKTYFINFSHSGQGSGEAQHSKKNETNAREAQHNKRNETNARPKNHKSCGRQGARDRGEQTHERSAIATANSRAATAVAAPE